ncbi:MAG: CubicO group peptidase (beta-lactamase class C family) [Lysobacterales bacterium]|jgi:CubicO group peptidase (beta-lactamase class C family)
MKRIFLLTFTFVLAACGKSSDLPTAPPRGGISLTSLITDAAPAGPVSNHWFMPQVDSGSALHDFSGVLRIPEHAMHASITPIEFGEYSAVGGAVKFPAPEGSDQIVPGEIAGKAPQLFPGLDIAFVSYGDRLLPVDRSLMAPINSNSFWQVQIAPGRIWSEPVDNGKSRASFPFMMTSNIENESYNGLATFVYDDTGVHSLRYQVIQQLTPFLVECWFESWGQVQVELESAELPKEQVVADYEKEIADQLEWRDWSVLQEKYGTELFEDFNSGIPPEKTVVSGLIIDNVVYVHSMDTPYGPYPYPREMRHGIWSATKTSAGLMTLLRMAQKYGDEILEYKVKDYIDVTADHDGWDDVTIAHTMSMTTGMGTGSEDLDPNKISDGYIYSDYREYKDWYLVPGIDEKTEHAFRVPTHPWGPGEYVRYRDRDIVIMAAALESLYQRKEGKSADMWGMMLDEVYGPLGIHHMPMNMTKETDRVPVPLLGWGIYTTVDDIAKIAALMQNGGELNGEQVLSERRLAEALYETEVRGLETGAENEYGKKSYHLSFWHERFVSDSGKVYSAPKMVGWGGSIVQLMPNGLVGFRFGNGGNVEVEQMMLIANSIKPFDEFDRRGERRSE